VCADFPSSNERAPPGLLSGPGAAALTRDDDDDDDDDELSYLIVAQTVRIIVQLHVVREQESK